VTEELKIKDAQTYTVKLYIAGPIEDAKRVIRRAAFPKGLCVTIEPTLYIYAGGEEAGYVVGLLQYPRYPEAEVVIFEKAEALLIELIKATDQWSGLLVSPTLTRFVSRRPE